MKKTVRKTIGALFLASAIAVAAIPVEGLQAGTPGARTVTDVPRETNFKVTISEKTGAAANGTNPATGQYRDMGGAKTIPTMDSIIPVITKNDKIYITEKNAQGAIFQFAYINYKGDYVAVLMGYSGGTLVNNTLTIPPEVAAYIQPSGNMGTGYGYVAASKNGTPLYYERLTTATREKKVMVDKLDDQGNRIPVDPNDLSQGYQQVEEIQIEEYTAGEMVPCYETDNAWKDLKLEMFYYEDAGHDITSTAAKQVNEADVNGTLIPMVYKNFSQSGQDSNYQWIKNAQVKYISNQYLNTTTLSSGIEAWTVGDTGNYIDTASRSNLSKGVFANESNIETLEISESVVGIGNAAFYNCASLKHIKFGNGLQIIGNWAFGACSWLQNVDVPSASRLETLGDHAFYACSSLTDIQVPHVVKHIGDYAFADCSILEEVELCDYLKGPSGSGLENMGWSVFENCETLRKLELPERLEGPLEMSLVKGCKSLQYIRSRNGKLKFTEGDQAYGFEDFKTMLEGEPVNGKFYFEGLTDSELHKLTKEQCFAFSHIIYNSNTKEYESRNRYEITLQLNKSANPLSAGVGTFVVGLDGSEDNTLLEVTLGAQVKNLEIPNQIGPKYVGRLKDNVFANKCSLETVHIPENMTYIGAGAFKGCHNVTNVIFDTSTVQIGQDAFKTQEFSTGILHACGGGVKNDADNYPDKKLNFIGEISDTSTPYRYAMNMDCAPGKLNNYNASNQNRSFITYYSGWPTNLEVRYQYDERTQTGYSELVDFPTLGDLTQYTDTDKYVYMADHASSLSGTTGASLLGSYNSGAPMPDDQADYVRAVLNLDIPRGVQKIKDGLFYDKNANKELSGVQKTVNVYGLDEIEEADFHQVEDYGLPTCTGELKKEADGRTVASDKLAAINIYGATQSVADSAFANSPNLKSVAINGSTSSIGEYAFDNCPILDDVTLSGSVSELGTCPFKDCKNLSNVVFQGKDYFTCADSMIFNADKTKLIECLPAKGKFVRGSEVATVTDIAPEAFSGTSVQEVDLLSSSIPKVPTESFANTVNLRTVKLPSTCVAIEANAFKGSNVDAIEMSQYLNLVDQNAFKDMGNLPENVTFCCPEGSYMQQYANMNGFDWSPTALVVYYEVSFRDWNEELGKNIPVGDTQWILAGDDAVPPTPAGKPGEVFVGWDPDYHEIAGNTVCTAQYKPETLIPDTVKVTFMEENGTIIKVVELLVGNDVRSIDYPEPPVKEGWEFIGWSGILQNVTVDTNAVAQYKENKDAEFTVRFKIKTDTGESIYATQTVKIGQDAIVPQDPVMEGQTFKGWWPEVTNVTHDVDTYAQFVPNGSIESTRFTVLFINFDESVLSSQLVYRGESAVIPQDPARAGYRFTGWLPSSVSNIQENLKVYAQYEKITDDSGNGGDVSGGDTNDGNGNGGNETPGGSTPAGGPEGAIPMLYMLTVRNGSGSGSYVAGAQPIIVANDPPAGQEFSNWTVDPESTQISSRVLPATVVTMPACNVTVTANFRAKTGSSSSSGSANTNTSGRPGGSSGLVSSGTTVVIDKNGISNTGVVSATVHGSSDNFTIKISESSAAAEAIIRALQAEYGTLDNIKYFPMDISLYDAAGTTKITDTTGLSIRITMPLPDSLITYAGNNKVAGVVNDRLDKLSPKFTTIDGVACVSFTAEHFSPYVIYVETNHLTAGANIDSTPKTGDGIHPKWFLSCGLAFTSAVFFMKKDKRKVAKVKAS